MNAQTFGCLAFLAVIKEFSSQSPPFKLEEGPLTAIEGSCIEIKCNVTRPISDNRAHWFWIKDATYNNSKKDFVGTVINSSDSKIRPVSGDYANRVTYNGSQSSTWNQHSTQPLCSILICNLSKSDSGDYNFRFVRNNLDEKWITKPGVVLNVTDNPCPITFEKPPVVIESGVSLLRCSTLRSCSSDLKIEGLPERLLTMALDTEGNQKLLSTNFSVTWKDDGKEFSCQTNDNKETYLIQKISLTVKYAPKEISAVRSLPDSGTVKEGQSVTLTCLAKGNPDPTFTWFNNELKHQGSEWTFSSIKASESGGYRCEANNTHGRLLSDPVTIDVQYAPVVEVKTSKTSYLYTFTKEEEMTLTCNFRQSNPKPTSYVWLKNNIPIWQHVNYVKNIIPDDAGFYKCQANNTVGTGTSAELQIIVRYSPRKTNISISEKDTKVKVTQSLIFTCSTDAYPSPTSFYWYRQDKIKGTESSPFKSYETKENSLQLESVQRTDEACYTCNAFNDIGAGENSKPVCIQVLYSPTTPMLSMDAVVIEGQLITISCTVESSPPSLLTLDMASTSDPTFPKRVSTHSNNHWRTNNLQHKFNVTSADKGFYTCGAENSIGSNKSEKKELVVKYHPKDVNVKADPDFVVNENSLLTLHCTAHSHPEVTSVTWIKTTDGKSEIIRENKTLTVKSVSLSDEGQYSCKATNEMGIGISKQATIKVKYAPKRTTIMKGPEQQSPDGKSSVMLSCTSHSFPEVTDFKWYKKIEGEERDVKVSDHQTYTVFSDKPGVYYCIAKNEINQKSSEPVHMFVDRGYLKVLIIILLLIVLVLVVVFFVYRHKKSKSMRRGHGNTQTLFGSLSLWIGARRRNLMTEPVMAEPSRSRDDLLPEQPCRSKNQRRQQPRPDNTPASNISTVYCTVKHPAGNQGPSGAMPAKQKAGHTQDESLNYSSLHFGKKQKNELPKAEVDVVYAVVSKKKPPVKTEQEKLHDYENIRTANGAKSQNPPNYDSDTSEDEVELNYSQVSFKAKSGHQRAVSDSSSSDEEDTQYSDIKF